MTKLSLIEKAFFLKKTALFTEVDLDLMLAISEKVDIYEFRKEELVFSHNQAAKNLFIIYSGRVDLFDGAGVHQATLFEPNFFGDEALFTHTRRAYTAIAKEDSCLLVISRSHLHEIIFEAPQVALALIRSYALATPIRRPLQ